MDRGFSIGHIFGINIRVDWSWLLIFVLVVWNLASVFGGVHPDWGPALSWGTALVAALLFFGSVLAHELAHSLVARARGIPVRGITLFLFGGVSNIQREPPSAGAEFIMAIVGPLTSVVLGAILLVIGVASAGPLPNAAADPNQFLASLGPLTTLLLWLGTVNIVVGIFNMIPAFPLDGGRVLRSIFWAISNNLRKATRWASWIGQGIAWLMIVAGIAMVFGVQLPVLGTGPISGLWLAFIGWFLNSSASRSYQQVELDYGPFERRLRLALRLGGVGRGVGGRHRRLGEPIVHGGEDEPRHLRGGDLVLGADRRVRAAATVDGEHLVLEDELLHRRDRGRGLAAVVLAQQHELAAVHAAFGIHLVEHDHGVVQRVADHGQDRRQGRQVERHPGGREESQDHDRVVQRRGNGTDAELPLEARPDVQQDEEEREQHGERAFLGEFSAHLPADDFRASQFDARISGLGRRQHLAPKHVVVRALLGKHAHQHVARGAKTLHHGIAVTRLLERLADLLEVGCLREAQLEHHAAGEVDAEVDAADTQRQQRAEENRQEMPSHSYDFSFSGIKTAVLRAAQLAIGEDHTFPSKNLPGRRSEAQKADIAASFDRIATETVVDKTLLAYEEFKPASIVIAGGVAASPELRRQLAERLPCSIAYTDSRLCTDNGAMIAAAGAMLPVVQAPWAQNADSGLVLDPGIEPKRLEPQISAKR